MKKNLLLLVLAICVGMFTSCGNGIDKSIDEFEKIVNKMEKTDDVSKLQILVQDGQKVIEEMDEKFDPKSLTKEQEARLEELGTKYAAHCSKILSGTMKSIGDMSDAFSKGVEDMSKAFNSIGEQSGDDNEEESVDADNNE